MMVSDLRCAAGHGGAWLYIEAIEISRRVLETTSDKLLIDAEWRTGEGFNDGLPDSAYLLCQTEIDGGLCVRRVEIPQSLVLEWD